MTPRFWLSTRRLHGKIGLLPVVLLVALSGGAPAQEPAIPENPFRLIEANWEVVRSDAEAKSGTVEWIKRRDGLDVARLSIAGGAPGEVSLASRKTLSGDFNVEVELFVPIPGAAPGSVVRTALGVARPEDHFRRRAYQVFREKRNDDGVVTMDRFGAVFTNGGQTKALPDKPGDSAASVTIRLERRGGTLTALELQEGTPNVGFAPPSGGFGAPRMRWVELARFDKPCDEPVHVVLTVSNNAGNKGAAFTAHSAVFSKLFITEPRSRKP